jgi:uncharacterized protein (DUF488 family)
MVAKIITLGAYGWDEVRFFSALQRAGVDLFCDLRFRRGVRGREYAFVNSRRLQARLAELGIRYVHFRDLAPSPALRSRQTAADKQAHTRKRQRLALSPEFVAGYQQQCLAEFDSARFAQRLGPDAKAAALFCVEREAAACHRSLLAERPRKDLGVEVVHVTPSSAAETASGASC